MAASSTATDPALPAWTVTPHRSWKATALSPSAAIVPPPAALPMQCLSLPVPLVPRAVLWQLNRICGYIGEPVPYFDGVAGKTYFKAWRADAPRSAAVIFLHGFGEHSGLYHRLGNTLTGLAAQAGTAR
jgi:hypothetical protein